MTKSATIQPKLALTVRRLEKIETTKKISGRPGG